MTQELCILTPVFNGATWLRACVENVASQWVPGITHWVVDGGSKDGSVEILQALSQTYSHLRFISEPDRGQSDAMNKSILLAGDQWIGFLNVDDFYEPGILPKMMDRIRATSGECLLMGNLNVVDADGQLLRLNRPAQMTYAAMLADMCEWPFNPSAYFYPARVHKTIGLFPVDEHFAMDYDFIFRILLHRIPVQYVDEVWGNFRLLPDAKTGKDQADNTSYLRASAVRELYFQKAPLSVQMEAQLRKVYWALRNKFYGLIKRF